jgi:hypothetical protein
MACKLGSHMGRSWMVDGKEMVAGISDHCETLHDHKEMSFGPIGVRTGGRNDEDRLGNCSSADRSVLFAEFSPHRIGKDGLDHPLGRSRTYSQIVLECPMLI